MIVFRLKNILDAEGISQNQFSKMSAVRPNTINNIYNNRIKRIELCTFEKILSTLTKLGYSIEDIIEYIDK